MLHLILELVWFTARRAAGLKILKSEKPDVVIGFGGYVCAPAVLAAKSTWLWMIIGGLGVGIVGAGAGELIAEVRSLRDFSVLESHVAPYDGGLASCGPERHHVMLPGEELATVQKGVEVITHGAERV